MNEGLIEELAKAVGWKNVLRTEVELLPFKYDASSFVGKKPLAVVLPENEDQVSKVMRLSYEMEFPIFLRGGGSSLTGGPLPIVKDSVVISFLNMNKIEEVSIIDSYVSAQAGVRLDDLNTYLSSYGYMFPPDPASSTVATIGGCIASNSGGMRGAKFGQVKNWVLGIDAILPGGEKFRTGGRTLKIRQGLDLTSILVGSEGILAAITRAYLKIWPAPEKVVRILAYYDELEFLMKAVAEIRKSRLVPLIMEFLDEEMLKSVRKVYGDIITTEGRNLLLLDVDGPPEALNRYTRKMLKCLKNEGLRGFKVAKTPEEMERAYMARRAAFPSTLKLRRKPSEEVLVADVVIPPSKLVDAIRRIKSLVENYGLRAPLGGHVGDGNLHSDIFYDAESEEEIKRAWELLHEMAETAIKFGGSVSAEHGIGLEKKELLKREFEAKGSPIAIELMMKIKQAFDPKNLLNPGKVL